jgi:hypothetical protein
MRLEMIILIVDQADIRLRRFLCAWLRIGFIETLTRTMPTALQKVMKSPHKGFRSH